MLLVSPAMGQSYESRLKALEEQFASFRRAHAEAPGELRLFNNDTCPPGWVETEATKGYVLVSRPKDASAGQVFNKPLAKGERWRVGPHTHDATVSDPGHAHGINDPGHDHKGKTDYERNKRGLSYQDNGGGESDHKTSWSTTGISVNKEKSGIGVAIEAAKSEGYPLAYVLLCQRNTTV